MNQPNIRSAIESEYSKCTEVRPGIYRAERIYGSHPIEVRYFDTSAKILDAEFEISEYQQNLLADDYYQNLGSIRWNYYLTFVVPENISDDPEFLKRKSAVERDYALARKSVLTPAELFKDFKKNVFATGDLPTNVVEVWRSHLSKAGISDALDLDIAYDDIIDSYLSGDPKRTKSSRKPTVGNAPKITSINELHVLSLSRPRPPVGSHFTFKRVNLICGPNAAGKTSLLESLELALCGNTLRADINKLEERFQFTIRTNQSDQLNPLKKLPIQEYRNRDRKWYGNTYLQGNSLPRHFAKFNFFDADAAKRFSEDLREEEINTAILGVIFGPESSQLQKRLVTLGERFGKEASQISHEVSRLGASMAAKRQSISSNKKRLEDLSNPRVDISGVQMSLPVLSESETDQTLAEWAVITITLENIVEQDPATGQIPIGVLSKRAAALEHSVGQLNQLAQQSEAQRRQIEKLQKEQSQADEKLDLIQLLRGYMNVNALELLDLPDRLISLQRRIDPLQLALRTIDMVALDAFSGEEQLVVGLEKAKTDFDISQKKYLEIDQQLAAEQSRLSGIKVLRHEIVDCGTLILQQLPGLDECPLCGTTHKSPSLADKVELQRTRQLSEGMDKLSTLSEAKRRLSLDLESLRQRVDHLRRIQNCLEALGVTNETKPSLATAMKEIYQARKKVEQLAEEKTLLSSRLQQLESAGFVRSELIETLSVLGLSPSRLVKNPSVVLQEAENAAGTKKAELGEVLSAATAVLTNLEAEISSLIENWDIKETDISRAIQVIRDRASNVQTVQTFLAQLRSSIVAAEEVSVYDLAAAMGHFHAALSRMQESTWLSKELALAREAIGKEEKELQDLEKRKKRAKSAEEIINNLIQHHGLATYGEQFLTRNSAAIRDFFLRIHAPREFSDVEIAKDHLKLIRADNKQAVTPAQVSTGQRSALALSVFLTINQLLQNGPDLLLLDDPVTYVDDLNVLAFIDFLREIAIQGNRQIFFATASRRIADIFRVKMDFLGEDFAEISLPMQQATFEPAQTRH